VSVDAAARLVGQSERWEFAIIGKNLTNEYVLTGAQDAPSTGTGTGTAAGIAADRYGFPAPPRTVLGQVTVRF
jgi:iron complex outermembrane recepter protein